MKEREAFIELRQAFANGIIELAKYDRSVMLVESDVPSPARKWFKKNAPNQFVNTGVAEANAVGICGGLASEGYTPFWYTYGFLIGRVYNQIKQSIAKDNRNVKIYGYSCGVSGIGGSSHNCVEDIGLMRTIPNMTIVVPADEYEMAKSVKASYLHNGPVYVRFPRDSVPIVTEPNDPFIIGTGKIMREGSDLTIICNGPMVKESLDALIELPFNVEVINMSTVKPLDYELILKSAKKTGLIVTAEEHYINGGMGEAVASYLSSVYPCPIFHVGVQDVFTQSGKGDLKDKYFLTSKYIKWLCEQVIGEKK